MKSKIQFSLIFGVFGIVLLSGCASKQKSLLPENFQALNDEWHPYPVQLELVPLEMPYYPLIWEEPKKIELTFWTEEVVTDELDSLEIQKEVINTYGYRVQLFSSVDYQTANSIMEIAEEKFEQIVYIDFEPPQYKVRIGNFINRDIADEFCRTLKREGFKDAWVVRSQIEVRNEN